MTARSHAHRYQDGSGVDTSRTTTVQVHLEELGEHSWIKALFNTLTGSYGSAQFRFVASPAGTHDASEHVAVSATFPVMRFQDLNDRTPPNGWIELAERSLHELDQRLTASGWSREKGVGPHWWSFTYRRELPGRG